MDMEEIRYLLGGTVFARAKAYTDRIQDLNCEVAGNGVRHLSADVRGGGRSLYQTQVWLRENGSFVSASCSCPYNENGEGPCCKHIGALLMWDSESQGLSGRAPQKPAESPESIPGVVRGTANLQTPQPEEPPRRAAMPPAWKCCSARSGGARNRNLTTRHGGCSGPIRREHWPRWTA